MLFWTVRREERKEAVLMEQRGGIGAERLGACSMRGGGHARGDRGRAPLQRRAAAPLRRMCFTLKLHSRSGLAASAHGDGAQWKLPSRAYEKDVCNGQVYNKVPRDTL